MYSGKVLQGYGFKFDTLYFTRGRWNYISPGAFDESLKTDHVRMLLEHDDSLCFGDNRSNLILESDQFGLAFRCHLRKDKISAHVTAPRTIKSVPRLLNRFRISRQRHDGANNLENRSDLHHQSYASGNKLPACRCLRTD